MFVPKISSDWVISKVDKSCSYSSNELLDKILNKFFLTTPFKHPDFRVGV